MSFLSRLRKSVKPKTKTLLPSTTTETKKATGVKGGNSKQPPVTTHAHCYENAACKSATEMRADEERKELKRSDTFILKEGPPDDVFYEPGAITTLNYGTYRKDKKNAAIETDVFETLYTKRPSKSSRSSRSSSGSFSADHHPLNRSISYLSRSSSVTSTTPTAVPVVARSPPKAPSIAGRISYFSRSAATPPPPLTVRTTSSPIRDQIRRTTTVVNVNEPTTTKPPEYLFGTYTRPNRPKNKENSGGADDKFKTITLKDVRRSFRDTYMTHDNTDDRQHQPHWFVDVDDDNGRKAAAQRRPVDKYEVQRPVSRKDTFKVIRNDSNYTAEDCDGVVRRKDRRDRSPARLQRRETFCINDDDDDDDGGTEIRFVDSPNRHRYRRDLDAIRVELKAIPDRAAATKPIGIATPYNSMNDEVPGGGRRRWKLQHGGEDDRDVVDFVKRKSPDRAAANWAAKPTTASYHSSLTNVNGAADIFRPIKKPIESLKSKFDFALRRAERNAAPAAHTQSNADLGFEKFYDPNYIMPRNRNRVYGPNAPGYRMVNLKVQPKPFVSSVRANPNTWMYNQVHV